MSVIRGNTTATPMKRPDMAETNEKKSSYIKNNPLAGLTAADDGKVLSVVDGKPTFVVTDKHTLQEAKDYTDSLFQELEEDGVTKIKTVSGQYLRIFVGTQAEYEALDNKDNLFAIFTDDPAKEEIMSQLESLAEAIMELQSWSGEVPNQYLKTLDLKTAIEGLQNDEAWVSFNFGDYCFGVGKTYCVQFTYSSNSYQFMFHVSNEGCWLPTIYTSDGRHTEIMLSVKSGGTCRLYGYIVNEGERTNLADLPTTSVKAKYRIIR